jgi:hypothetical protein
MNKIQLESDIKPQMRRQFIALTMKRVRPGTGSGLDFLNHRTWSFPVTDLRTIIKEKHFVIVGGVATRLYMPERATLDLDILILARDAQSIYRELAQQNCLRLGDLTIPGSQWQLSDGTSLDVLESDEDWAEEAIIHPNYAPDGLPVISLPYLILMKLRASRTQDLADISRMLGGASEETLQEIRQVIGKWFREALEDLESLIVLGKLERVGT